MKIGIYDPYLDDLGGGEKYMMMIATCLAQQHEVTVFWDNDQDIVALKNRFGFSFEKITFTKNIFSSHVGFIERARISRQYDGLIVLSDGSIPLVFSRKLYLHIQQPLQNALSSTLKDKIKKHRITEVFYNSQFTQRCNSNLFPGVKKSVIYPPVTLIKSNNQQKEKCILHVGRFRVKNIKTEDYKKQGFMIETFKKMVDQGLKGWKFILAASVRKEDEARFTLLQKTAKGYPIEFHINKTNSELFTLYHKAAMYWHASGYGEDIEKYPEMAEHFGISTVEAMGAGAVPVVINSGGQKEIVTDGENGLLWNTQEELIQQTKRLVKDKKLLYEFSQKAMLRAKDFSKEKFCEAVQYLINNEE